MARPPAPLVLLLLVHATTALAQGAATPTSRAQAIEAALARGAQLGIARADTAFAAAQVLTARAYQNPTLAASYTKSTPRYHVEAELPLDLLGVRGARVRSAQAARAAARYRFASARAAIALDADTSYTRAAAARARLALSERNAHAADSLRRMSIARRDAGDASDLDVELATVNAGQQENAAAADSLALLSAVLDLQQAMGLPADRLQVLPTDSLVAPPDGAESFDATPLPVAAARAALDAAQLATIVARRGVWPGPTLTAGVETGDPHGDERGVLPVVGVAVPLPFLDRNRGPIAEAEATRARARAELALAELESGAAIARARRELRVALARVARDRALVGSANRVATLSLTGYREGATALPTVLEAQRNARDVIGQYVDDLAAAWIAGATLRALTAPATVPSPDPASR